MRRAWIPFFVVLMSATALALYRPASASVLYSVSQVTTFSNVGFTYGLSPDRSKVAGVVVTGAPSQMRATVKSGATVTQVNPLAGFTNSIGQALNDSGQAVGILSNTLGGYATGDRAFYYDGVNVTQLPTLTTTSYTHAYDINNAQTVVGLSSFMPFKVHVGDAALVALPTIPAISSNGAAASINNAGDIVGWLGILSGSPMPVIWHNGSVSTLALAPGATQGAATLINEQGWIIGSTRSTGPSHGAIYQTNGAATDIGALALGFSEALDVNSAGQVVGDANVMAGSTPISHAILYQTGQLLDLNDVIAPRSGMVLARAISIDDSGDIFGTGFLAVGGNISFELTPIPEPSIALVTFTIFVLSARARRTSRRGVRSW